jgi:hypothetical protein
MGIFRNLILALGITTATYMPAKADLGLDVNVGYSGITLDVPDNIRNLKVNAVDGSVVNLELPESKNFSNVTIGIAPYVYTDRLKFGIEINLKKNLNTFKTVEGRQGEGKLASEDWSRWEGGWPKAGAYADIDEYNLGFIEYSLIKGKRGSFGFFGKLNLYDIQIKKFSTNFPSVDVLDPYDPAEGYPLQNEDSLEDSIVQETVVFKETGLGSKLGIKYRNTTNKGYEWNIDATVLVPLTAESVKPNLEIRTGIGAQF